MKTRVFEHSFEVEAPLADVAAFHARSASMGAITPPPIIARLQRAPEILGEGDEMAFTLWMGPFPLRWLARIQDVGPTGFTDVQLRGPYAHWSHRHAFIPLGDGRCRVEDRVEACFRREPFWALLGSAMWLGMKPLFAYRAWRTRRLLEA